MQELMKQTNLLVLWHPETILLTVLGMVSYFIIIGPLRTYFPNGNSVSVGQRTAFVSALMVMYVALGTPVAFFGDRYSFTVFVLQTILLMQVMPWLILLGLPSWLLQPVFKVPWIRRTLRVGTYPIFTCSIFGISSTVLFIPAVFSLYLHLNWFHILYQLILFISSILLWWPLFSPVMEYPRLTPGRQLLYLLYASGVTMPINVLILIAQKPWYLVYQHASQVLSLSPLGDQQRGGLLMFVGMIVIYGAMGVKAFWAFDGHHWGE